MKIVLASIHPRALSGQIDSLVGLAHELTGLGHHVRVVSAFPEAPLLEGHRLELSNHDGVAPASKLVRIHRILSTVAEAGADSDLVHLNLPTPAFSVLGDFLQWRSKAPVVIGYEAPLAPAGLWHCLGRRSDLAFYLPRWIVNNRLAARATLRRAERYLVSTKVQADELVATGADRQRISVIPNLIDANKLRLHGRAEARAALGLPDAPLVGYIGHYNPVKGADVLVRAFAAVHRMAPEAKLVLAWSGLGDPAPVNQELDRFELHEAVIQLGKVDAARFLAAMDVLALPYRMAIGQEAFPSLLLEAMAVNVPLVTSDLPLLREAVEAERTALLSPPGNASALAGQITRLLLDRQGAARMRAAQAAVMAGQFHPTHLAEHYETIYRDILSAHSLRSGRQAPVLQPQVGGGGLRPAALRRAERRLGERAGAGDRTEPAAPWRKSA